MNYYESYLTHYGVKGMKWGVRRKRNPVALRLRMNIQLFAKRPKSLKTVKLSREEYARVMHEVTTHASALQKTMPIFSKPIDSYTYTFENHFDGTYRVVGRKKISKSTTGILKRNNDDKR